MSKGMQAGLAEAQKALAPTRVSRLLLLTDGQTYGDEAQCRQLAADAGQLGVPITALGLGDDWNEELLDAIAQASGGTADFVDVPQKIQQYFQGALQSMQATVVSNAQLILRLVGGVTPRQVWRVIPLISQLSTRALSDRDVQVQLGELEKDQGQALLVELLLPPRPAGQYRIAQAEVSYDVPAARIVGEKVRSDILLTFTADPMQAQAYDPRVMNLVEKVTAFKLQTRALDEARAGNVVGATQKLRAAATRLLEMGETDLAAAAEEEARRLEQGQAMSAAGTKKLQYGTRKLTQQLDS
jgi:Ca-activated chloride channel family protein